MAARFDHARWAPFRQPWTAWWFPQVFRRRRVWLGLLCLGFVGFQLIMYGLLRLHLHPGSVVVTNAGVPQHELFRSLLSFPVCLIMAATEMIALGHLYNSRCSSLQRRPLAWEGFWWEVQRRGLGRSAAQVGLALLFLGTAYLWGARGHTPWWMLGCGVLLLPLARSLFAANCGIRVIRPLCGTIVGIFVDVVPIASIFAVFVLSVVLPTQVLTFRWQPSTLAVVIIMSHGVLAMCYGAWFVMRWRLGPTQTALPPASGGGQWKIPPA